MCDTESCGRSHNTHTSRISVLQMCRGLQREMQFRRRIVGLAETYNTLPCAVVMRSCSTKLISA